jgi:hypothetical protein
MHASDLTDLVGREEELELLLRRWSRAPAKVGVVLLSGEAGIGKSQLTAALLKISRANHPRACAISAHRTTSVYIMDIRRAQVCNGSSCLEADMIGKIRSETILRRRILPISLGFASTRRC